jgi:hypothetical protein
MDCASFDPKHPIHPNSYPYFVGAFDTVAALGSLAQGAKFVALYGIGAAVVSRLISLLPNVPLIGPYLRYLQFAPVFLALVGIPVAIALAIYIFNGVERAFNLALDLDRLEKEYDLRAKGYGTSCMVNLARKNRQGICAPTETATNRQKP